MDDPRSRFDDLLDQGDELWYGPQERALIDEAVALADEIDDDLLRYRARMRLTNSATFTGDTDTQLSAFAWCLAMYDKDPQRFASEGDILWQYKWMIGALDGSPIFSLSQAEEMLDDMETHYRRAGLGTYAVIDARWNHAWYTGDLDRAVILRDQLLATPRDDHSDCEACTRCAFAGFALDLGDEAEALRLVDEMVNGNYRGRHSCAEEPECALSKVLIPMLHVGQFDEARAAHTRSYRLARNNPDLIAVVARHLQFCAVTGNEARGLAMVERHLRWLVHDSLGDEGRLLFLLGVAVLLTAVARAGHGDEIIRSAASADLVVVFGEHEGQWRADELADSAWLAAQRIADAFDARNGNMFVSGRIAGARALLDEHYDVPIYSDAFLDAPPAPAQPADAEGMAERAQLLCDQAQELGADGQFDKALADADEATRLFATLRASVKTAEAAAVAGKLLLDAGRPEEALVRYRYALRELDQLEEPPVWALFGYGRALLDAGHPLEAGEAFAEVLRIDEKNDSAAGAAEALQWLGLSHERCEQFEWAVDYYQQAAEKYEEAGDLSRAVSMLISRSNIHARFGHFSISLDDLRDALELAKQEGGYATQASVLERMGCSKVYSGDPSGLNDLDQALAMARANNDEENAAVCLRSMGHCLASLDRWSEADAAFLSAADAFAGTDEPSSVECEMFAGQILADQNQMAQSVPILRSALDRAKALNQDEYAPLRKTIALNLGDILESLGDLPASAQARAEAE